jgi:hypothetical protein
MNGNNIPKWKLEWYLAGALPPRELAAIGSLEESDQKLRGRIDALRASNAEILAKYPSAVMAKKAMAANLCGGGGINCVNNFNNDNCGGGGKKARSGIPRWTIPAFACAALLAILPVRMVLTGQTEDNSNVVYNTRTKGEVNEEIPAASLEVWRKTRDEAERLAPQAAVSAGDIVQLRYIVPQSCYGALLSVDGRGTLTVHLSGNDGRAALLTAGRPVALKQSYKLDDAPKFEAFYLITAQNNFNLEAVRLKLMDVKHPAGGEQELLLPQKQIASFILMK